MVSDQYMLAYMTAQALEMEDQVSQETKITQEQLEDFDNFNPTHQQATDLYQSFTNNGMVHGSTKISDMFPEFTSITKPDENLKVRPGSLAELWGSWIDSLDLTMLVLAESILNQNKNKKRFPSWNLEKQCLCLIYSRRETDPHARRYFLENPRKFK